MKRKWRPLFMALFLAVTVLVPVAVNPPTVEAAWNGIIMPGRVLRDHGPNPPVNTSACRAIAYGRVDSNLVLFVAAHCRDAFNEQPYNWAYTNGGVPIGWWGVPNISWENNDLTYITLDVNSVWYPTSGRNKIYRGDFTDNGLTSDDYWYMTTQPTGSDGCAGYPIGGDWLDDNTYNMWQRYMTTTTDYRVGTSTQKTYVADGCLIHTNLTVHNNCCDSSSPWVGSWDTTTLAGSSTDQIGTFLRYSPLYEGLQDLDAYFDTHGNNTGAKLCITSSCPV